MQCSPTAGLGLTAFIMALVVLDIALKTWATKREPPPQLTSCLLSIISHLMFLFDVDIAYNYVTFFSHGHLQFILVSLFHHFLFFLSVQF